MAVEFHCEQGSRLWRELHEIGSISSSMAATVAGVNQYESAFHLWHLIAIQRRSPFDQDDDDDEEQKPAYIRAALQAGHENEASIARVAHLAVRRHLGLQGIDTRIRTPGILRHARLHWMITSPDRFLQRRVAGSLAWQDVAPRVSIECKYVMDGTLPVRPRPAHVIQLTHQMGVAGNARQGYLAYATHAESRLRVLVFCVQFSYVLWSWLLAELAAFRESIVTGEPLEWGESPALPLDRSFPVERFWSTLEPGARPEEAQDFVEYMKLTYGPDDWRTAFEALPPAPVWTLIAHP